MRSDPLRFVLDGELEPRAFVLDDAPELHAAIHTCFEHLRTWLPDIARIRELNDARDWIARRVAAASEGTSIYYGLWRAERIVGCVGFHDYRIPIRRLSLGCWLIEGEQGAGLMFGTASAFIERCRTALAVDRVDWDCEVANLRSTKLAERLGFTLDERRLVPSRFDSDLLVEQAYYRLTWGAPMGVPRSRAGDGMARKRGA